MTAYEGCRSLLGSCRPMWRAGHGDQAWATLQRAEALAAADEALEVEALAVRAGLHLLAENLPEGVRCAREAIARGEQLLARGASPEAVLREAVADATVTLASMAAGGPYPCTDQPTASALRTLDEIATDPALAGSVPSARAINNALNMRLHGLRGAMHTTEGQVDAWISVSRARTLIRQCADQGSVLRQALDLGIDCGQWERAWSSAQELITQQPGRNELVAALAKAALLAWHRGLQAQARDLGEQARSHSEAVDHPWVRIYAYQGGVIAAASGAGGMAQALSAYTRCTSVQGHATRPHRAWHVASIALESGHPVEGVEEFIRATLPGGMPDRVAEGASVVLADARGHEVDLQFARRALSHPWGRPDQARLHLAVARTLHRQGRRTAAARELAKARTLMRDWPGWLLQQIDQLSALVDDPVQATPAQQRVLDLVAEGMSNAQVATALDLSPRTVAVHIASLLKTNRLTSRTALVAQHLRSALPAEHFAPR